MSELSYIPRGINGFDIIDYIKTRPPKDRLPYHGIYLFCGKQGSGKTLSAVDFVYNLSQAYKINIITNLELKFDNDTTIYEFKNLLDFFKYNDKPRIYLIDEMHLLFNSLQSKNANTHIFEAVSQQRKNEVMIVGTSQVYGRLAKPFREQINTVITCERIFCSLHHLTFYRSEVVEKEDDITTNLYASHGRFFTANKTMYERYDTKQIIEGDENGLLY